MPETRYRRYVAIGDSQTEGLWDGDDAVGLAGYADQLAAIINRHYPGLQYANLAVRGKTINDALTEQLPQALAMKPDLITVCVGMNDITRPGRSFSRALADLQQLHSRLAASGATVLTTTFPNLARILPAGRLLTSRVLRTNEVIAASAARFDFKLVDVYDVPSIYESKTWSFDLIHASGHGHKMFAAAAAEALDLPGSGHDWALPSHDSQPPSTRARARAQLQWTQNMLLPWAWCHLLGRSSSDGRSPKRPHLRHLDAPAADYGLDVTADASRGGWHFDRHGARPRAEL